MTKIVKFPGPCANGQVEAKLLARQVFWRLSSGAYSKISPAAGNSIARCRCLPNPQRHAKKQPAHDTKRLCAPKTGNAQRGSRGGRTGHEISDGPLRPASLQQVAAHRTPSGA